MTLCLRTVLFGNPDPAVGDLVQVDQVVGLDLASLSQAGDHFLDQRWVILGELNRQGGYMLSVEAGQHDPSPEARFSAAAHVCTKAGTKGLITAAICGTRKVSIRARPEPPSSTPTARISLVTGTANMVFSFSE
jgi:hypothetical protein